MKTLASLLLALLPLAAISADDHTDLAVVHRIKTEAFKSSHVMDHMFQLTDMNGPRLTGSPGWQRAAEWAERQMHSWGLENTHLEAWGPFGQGWKLTGFEMHLTKPEFALLHGIPLAWSAATPGSVRVPVIAAPLYHEDDAARDLDVATMRERVKEFKEHWQGKLRGKAILLNYERDLGLPTDVPGKRLQAQDLSSVSEAPQPMPGGPPQWVPDRLPGDRKKRNELMANLPFDMEEDYWHRRQAVLNPLNEFLKSEGVALVLRVDRRGTGGLLFAEAASYPSSGGQGAPPTVVLEPEQYNRLWRLIEKSVPVEVSADVQVEFIDSPTIANVIGEIPGTSKKDEVVMLGAHLDSWHAGTGATDNAAGCAVMLEAMRILKTLQLKMDRTVRVALWSGEEQGLLGSRAYVREHFGDSRTMTLKPEHDKLAAYFNVDNGSGKIRGIHLQGNDMVRPIFEAWLAPFKDLGATTVTIRDTGGTDHLSFDAVGLPGFQFVQDPLDYGSRTHHSDLDVYDHVEPSDLMQAAAIVASFAYNAATRTEMLPRKPLPTPLPPKPPEPKRESGVTRSGATAPEGFTSLFNGRDLSGWTVRDQGNRDWTVVDGVIDCDPHTGPGDRNLWTERSYRNFELLLDWRIKQAPYFNESARMVKPDGSYQVDSNGRPLAIRVPNADSGIFLRGEHKSQVNIWCWPVGSGEVWGYRTDPSLSSEVHASTTPKVRADRPVGEWNRFHIVLRDDRLTVDLNGTNVIENASLPGIPSEGPIALQQHGDRTDGEWGASFVQFRNVYLRELD